MNTLGFYNKNARNYSEQTRMVDLSELYVDFEECLNPGARILGPWVWERERQQVFP